MGKRFILRGPFFTNIHFYWGNIKTVSESLLIFAIKVRLNVYALLKSNDMKNATLFICLIFLKINGLAQPKTWIRINQLGYLTTDVKVAVLVSKDAKMALTDFQICDALTEQPVFSAKQVKSYGAWGVGRAFWTEVVVFDKN